MPLKNILNLTNLTLLVALALSTTAAYYSIIGLTAIFAGAVIPVIIMGSVLEVGKITTTVWLRKYWKHCGWMLKLYLVPAVVALAVLTSMGIFGFLSKAHMEQGVTSGDVQAKLSLIDEKIKTQRDNVELARKALQQMDAQVDARLSRGDSENSAERAVAIRRQQASERSKLQKEIGDAQKVIAQLNEERAPIAAENRKVEAEVGPIKYVAALIYGDNPDANLLERAVRWVIILLVIVFDPLAIALVLAANSSKDWDKAEQDDKAAMNINPEPEGASTRSFTEEEIKAMDEAKEPVQEPWPTVWEEADLDRLAEETVKDIEEQEKKVEETKEHTPETHPYLNQGFKYPEGWGRQKPLVYTPEEKPKQQVESIEEVNQSPVAEETVKDIERKYAMIKMMREPASEIIENVEEEPKQVTVDQDTIITEGVTTEKEYEELADGWVKHDGKTLHQDALKRLKPELFAVADDLKQVKTGFGITFPAIANRGDVFVRVDVLPNRVFKFDGTKWLELRKEQSDTYLDNKNYIQFLINKIYTGEYDIDSLTDEERTHIESFLKNQNS